MSNPLLHDWKQAIKDAVCDGYARAFKELYEQEKQLRLKIEDRVKSLEEVVKLYETMFDDLRESMDPKLKAYIEKNLGPESSEEYFDS